MGPTLEARLYTLVSVSKPADLGRWSQTVLLRIEGNRRQGHDVYPGSGPLNGGNTLLSA